MALVCSGKNIAFGVAGHADLTALNAFTTETRYGENYLLVV